MNQKNFTLYHVSHQYLVIGFDEQAILFSQQNALIENKEPLDSYQLRWNETGLKSYQMKVSDTKTLCVPSIN